MTSTKYLIPKKIGSVIIFVLVIVQGFSQKLIVSNFKELPTDISAREFEVLDVNDEPCALLKVYTGFKNIKVDGNRGIEKLEEKNGEVWIWVSHGTRQLKFSKEGFPLLPFYFENELEKSTVYALELSSDEMHSIVIHTGTETTDVFIANKKYTSNVTIPGFSEGNYPVKIVKLGYKTIFDTLRVTKDNLYFSYSLEPIQQQKLKIKSIPTGAFLIINGQPVGNTDFTGFYYPGEYRIQLSKKDYLPIDTLIVFESSKSSEVLLTMGKNFAWLRFYAKPTTARIMLDGNLVANLSQHRLDLGTPHQLIVQAPYYRTYQEALKIQRGDSLNKIIELESQKGELAFVIEPEHFKINVVNERDSFATWNGSSVINLPVGDYQLDINEKGYRKYDTLFQIKDFQRTTLNVTMVERNFNRFTGGALSALLPGGGQFYAQRQKMGFVYMVSTFVLAGASGYFYMDADKKSQTYKTAQTDYLNETNIANIENARNAMNQAYDDYEASAKLRNTIITTTGIVYLINIIDAAVFTRYHAPLRKKGDEKPKIGLYNSANSIGLNLTYTF
ncbi:MAG TPA: hypothetical protein DCQ26_17055 [Marinilabiliales bacterium]|jgi:hypothetical protein|nr:MAG: hypothetical protein A2W95_10275 [Bacteroidetes bacterium GWA2_40_14]OFX59460.1 MAG: hypothetical protein A2W84_08840 [Bacteroidetes bacterium GWC2_40_13]OFX74260.1 MAG: hypothetical protein A2W96_03190 [Bacteroidetes bacterium GWD2_40_43]OFX92772.1 MAG: hypothetical protein A2W97_00440 [Bacteroidetes bacterium GWE2_40_63]OFY23179.1 MAG: hypothetical protein A2W88_12405 [Bacteroidetes bacterium GWF2_40_13]OFZ27783.1 MAG: hypothetical protein A2437_01055 [Bacteroidetes bacterium RIFOXYC